eukprot:368197_1
MAEKEKNLDANWIAYQTITAQALYVCFIPFLVYGIIKWIALKRHIVIMKRFPMVSIVMILLGFFNSTWWICQAWMRYSSQLNYTPYSYNVLHVRSSVSLSFATNGLINLRLFLTYLRWKHNRIVSQRTSSSVASKSETIDKTIDILSSDQKTIHKTQRKVTHKLYTHWFSITIILLTLFGFFCITFIMKAFIVWSTWTFVMIITIILIIMIIINKVKDGIGSTKEGLAMVIIFIFGTVNASLNRIGGVVPYISHIVLSLIVYIQALYPLYIALYYIYKIDGTLTTKDERESETETETEIHSIVIIDNDKNIFDVETEENYGGNIYEPKIMAMSLPKPKKPNKSIKTPPSYRPPPPKVPNMPPPPIPNMPPPNMAPPPKVPNMAPKVPNMAPKVPNMAPKVPNMAPKVPNMAPKVPNMAPKVPNMA